MKAGEPKRPYSRWLFLMAKYIWTLGERILRALLLNRCAPRVGGIDRDVRYRFGGNRLQVLDVFRPRGGHPWPVLVYIHGGGFHFGDKGTYDRICRRFASGGYLVCNVNYRMAPRWGYPEQVQDVAAAIAWAAENAVWFGGDPERVFLAGDSAGAYFAAEYAALALDGELARKAPVAGCLPPSRLRGLLLFYGAFDFDRVQRTSFPFVKEMATGFLGRDPAVFAERAEDASPLRHIAPGFPPCFIATSEIDPLHPESLDLGEKLSEAGLPFRLLALPAAEYPFTWHGFLNFWWCRGARLAMREALAFLDEHR